MDAYALVAVIAIPMLGTTGDGVAGVLCKGRVALYWAGQGLSSEDYSFYISNAWNSETKVCDVDINNPFDSCEGFPAPGWC